MINALMAALGGLASTLLGRVLVGAGMSLTIYTGLDILVSSYISNAVSSLTGITGGISQLALLGGVGQAFNILFSAILTRLAINAAIQSVSLVSK
ncbi:DUF2523 family protein [Agarivorans litoreus]|uniref:DUF2523 family protein n=1 Tax=Agarivorans litoreus TaxID=1510455 RepID=UPI001C7D5E16|nr:DUF2523 family protein [Agarivorans litoreus]